MKKSYYSKAFIFSLNKIIRDKYLTESFLNRYKTDDFDILVKVLGLDYRNEENIYFHLSNLFKVLENKKLESPKDFGKLYFYLTSKIITLDLCDNLEKNFNSSFENINISFFTKLNKGENIFKELAILCDLLTPYFKEDL